MNEEPMVLLELKLARFINPNGGMSWVMTTPEKFSPVDALGLLLGGIWQVFEEMSKTAGR
jgi:hypothetical protein